MSSVKENIIQIKFLAVEEHYISGSPAAISLLWTMWIYIFIYMHAIINLECLEIPDMQ